MKLNNLFILVGLPTVGKTTITNLIKKKLEVEIVEEDFEFIKMVNSKKPNLPKFNKYSEYMNWRNKNRDKTSFLYEKTNGNTFIENSYQEILEKSIKKAKDNPKKIFFLDTGGYSYTRKIHNGNIIYLQFENVTDFYKSFKKKYNRLGDIYAYAPFNNKMLLIDEFNYKNFYNNINKKYKSMSNQIIINSEKNKSYKEIIKYLEQFDIKVKYKNNYVSIIKGLL